MPAPDDAPASPASPVVAFVALAISLLFAVYLGSLGVVLPALGVAFDLGTEVQGRLFPASFGGSVTGVLLCGPLSDRWGRKPVVLLCLAATGAGLALLGIARAFLLVLLAAALVGGGGAAGQTVSAALLSDLYPARRAALLNAVQVAFGVGAIFGPVLMRFAAPNEQATGWRVFFLVAAALQAVLLALFALSPVPETRPKASTKTDSGAGVSLLRETPLLILCVSAALYSGAEVALFSWMPTRLKTDMANLPLMAWAQGAIVSVFWVGMTVGRLLLGAVLSRPKRPPLPRLRLLLASCGAVASGLALLAPNPVLSLVGVGLSGLCFSGIFSLLLAEGGERYASRAGAALGLIVATSGAGAAAIPWICGALSGAGANWAIALLPVPLAVAGVALLAAFAQSREKRLLAVKGV